MLNLDTVNMFVDFNNKAMSRISIYLNSANEYLNAICDQIEVAYGIAKFEQSPFAHSVMSNWSWSLDSLFGTTVHSKCQHYSINCDAGLPNMTFSCLYQSPLTFDITITCSTLGKE